MNYKIISFIIILLITSTQAQDKIKIPFHSEFTYAFSNNEQVVNPVNDPYNYYQQKDTPDMVGQKSTGLAFFISLALPGSGEF